MRLAFAFVALLSAVSVAAHPANRPGGLCGHRRRRLASSREGGFPVRDRGVRPTLRVLRSSNSHRSSERGDYRSTARVNV
jgi:hypothetical protein